MDLMLKIYSLHILNFVIRFNQYVIEFFSISSFLIEEFHEDQAFGFLA